MNATDYNITLSIEQVLSLRIALMKEINHYTELSESQVNKETKFFKERLAEVKEIDTMLYKY
jgi:hypothetical protein